MTADHLSVRIYNPLHKLLEHFVKGLSETLNAGGISTVLLPSPDGEVGGEIRAKALALGAHVSSARRYVHQSGTNVVAWPLLGWWEMPLWRHRTHKTLIVMHDPEPLGRQNGISPRAARLSRLASGSKWPQLVVLSPEAYEISAQYFDRAHIHMAPHPMALPSAKEDKTASRTILVLGRYKPARDLEIMTAIAPVLRAGGWEPTVVGSGWPLIPGWRVVDKFLSEAEIDTLLQSAAVVLLPYRFYFQSGVVLRALEAGVPVVGRETGFLSSILGTGFPGLVKTWDDPGSWILAVEAAVAGQANQLLAAAAYSRRGTSEWCSLLSSSALNGE
ncbi:MAG: glycosyltransferase [Actinomycetota bacterium]